MVNPALTVAETFCLAVLMSERISLIRSLERGTFYFSGHWSPRYGHVVFNGGAVLLGDQKGLGNRSSTIYE